MTNNEAKWTQDFDQRGNINIQLKSEINDKLFSNNGNVN